MKNSPKSKDIRTDLDTFLRELSSYQYLQERQMKGEQLDLDELRLVSELRITLLHKVGEFRQLITELTHKDQDTIYEFGKPRLVDIWHTGLTQDLDYRAKQTLSTCIDITNEAIGRLKTDIEQDRRDVQGNLIKVFNAKTNWNDIENEFGITKISFGRKINFVSDEFRRKIIFRDVEHAFLLASTGFSKPAVILAGGVIEELLRLYLEYKNVPPISDNFDGYIKTCEEKGLLKSGISRLSDSVRHFRNLVHLSKEQTKRYTISKATAKGAVSSIFTIANDF